MASNLWLFKNKKYFFLPSLSIMSLTLTPSSKKRKIITLDVKYQLVQQHNNGKRPIELEKLYELSSSTVSTIIKHKEKIIKEYELNEAANGSKRNKQVCQIHQCKYADIDSAVDQWFSQAINNNNVVIGGPEIREQALKYAVYLQHPEFTASSGWLSKFRKRHHISYKTIVGEAGLVDRAVTDEYLKNVLPGLLADYHPSDIFNK